MSLEEWYEYADQYSEESTPSSITLEEVLEQLED